MAMQVILLEHVDNLGNLGDVVKVKPGFARNYLIPQNKALRATDDNIAYFETQKKDLEKQNEARKNDAEKDAKKINDLKIALIRHASETGQLYGSVSAKDIADAVSEKAGMKIAKSMVTIHNAFKTIGLFPVTITLHPEVKVDITINIARTEDEAKLQEKSGKALIADNSQDSAVVKAEAEEALENSKKELMEEDALKADTAKASADAEKEAEKEAESQAKSEKRAAKKAEAAESEEGEEASEEANAEEGEKEA